jgi:hypothetical protein
MMPSIEELLLDRYTQHALASLISRFLSTHYASGTMPTPISVIAHDPDYTPDDAHVLDLLDPPIDVVSSPHHFLAITPHTLVICIFLPNFVPYFEVIADLCFPGGPAAMLCNEVVEFRGI